MPPFATRETDPVKKYGWVLIVAAVFVALWLTTSHMSGTGSDSVHIDESFAGSATEQGLASLDAIDAPSGAPGNNLAMPGAGAYAKKSGDITDPGLSSLYQAPERGEGPAGEPIEGADADQLASAANKADPSDNFANAMAKVAAGAPKKSGWGGKKARSGISRRPKAKFGKVGLSRGGGGTSSSASLQVVDNPFGTGGQTGGNFRGRQAPLASSGGGKLTAKMNRSRNMSGLRGAEKQALSALKGNGESAASMASRTFDASGTSARSLKDLAAQSNAAAMVSGDGVPTNLKATDPNKMTQKEFTPPEIEKAKEVDDNKEYMQQKIMMMIISAAISGIVGPIAGGIGTAVISGMGMSPPSSTASDRVPSSTPATT
jgi:hypothetical protein